MTNTSNILRICPANGQRERNMYRDVPTGLRWIPDLLSAIRGSATCIKSNVTLQTRNEASDD